MQQSEPNRSVINQDNSVCDHECNYYFLNANYLFLQQLDVIKQDSSSVLFITVAVLTFHLLDGHH